MIISLVAIILFRITLLDWTYKGLARDDGKKTFLFSQARLLTSLAASTLNLFVIICLNKVCSRSVRYNYKYLKYSSSRPLQIIVNDPKMIPSR